MSKAAVDWADAQDIEDPVMTAVLFRLAYQHHARHALFPSQATLAAQTKFSRRTVWEALKLLELLGVITRKSRSRGAGGRTSDKFEIALARAPFRLNKKLITAARADLRNSHVERTTKENSQLARGARGPRTRSEGIVTEQSPIHEGITTDLEVSTVGEAPVAAIGWTPKVVGGGRP